MVEIGRVENPPLPEEGRAVRVVVGGIPLAVFRIGGTLYALDARCTHVGGPLEKGAVQGTLVTCPWHGSVFDVRDGSVVHGPASRSATSYRLRIEGSTLVVDRN